MDLNQLKEKLNELFLKYRYAALVLLIGLALMLFPGNWEENKTEVETNITVAKEMDAQEELASILSRVHGAGKVEIILSIASGEKTVFQTDSDLSDNGEKSSSRMNTVIISDGNRKESGLVTQVNPPQYMGAIVVCQGAGDPVVRLAIVEAVSKYTGLGADKIAVLEMK